MQAHEYEKFAQILTGVHDFYSKDLSEFSMSVWWEALRPFDVSAVSQAFSRHIANTDTGQFPPKPADVLKMLGGRTQDRALMAWSKVDRAVRSVGNYESVAFDDPVIHRVIHEMGGWIGLGQKTEDDWPFVAKEFENRYRGYAMRSETPDYPPTLIGIAEAHNSRNGLATERPRLIGNAGIAAQVMHGGSVVNLIGMARASESTMKALGVAA